MRRLVLLRAGMVLLGFFVVAPLMRGSDAGPVVGAPDVEAPRPPGPQWTSADARDFPGCVPWRRWHHGQVPRSLVVYRFRDKAHVRLPFDRAWALNHDATGADDLWVLGGCR